MVQKHKSPDDAERRNKIDVLYKTVHTEKIKIKTETC